MKHMSLPLTLCNFHTGTWVLLALCQCLNTEKGQGLLTFYIHTILNVAKSLNKICLEALQLFNLNNRQTWCLHFVDQNKATDTGWVCSFLNQLNKRRTCTSLLHAASWKRKWQMRRGVNGLKPEMTSIASARQSATMIKNGKKERVERKS